MSSISRSFKRKSVLQRRQYNDDVRRGAMKIAKVALQGVDEKYQQDIKTYNDAAIIVTAAAAANVLVEHWGKMQKKETRKTVISGKTQRCVLLGYAAIF